MSHTPVLLYEVLTFLDPQPGDFIIDGTVDGGGHAAAILEKIGSHGTFLGIDWDSEMLARTKKKIAAGAHTVFHAGNYANLPEILSEEKLGKADGLLLDLGFSSEQLAGRGFSFSDAAVDEPLLMTYSDAEIPVRELLRSMREEELANILFEFGGERFSRRIAKVIVEEGRRHPIMTAGVLRNAVRSALSRGYEHGRIDPATRTFQALRIYANHELDNLSKVLEHLNVILKPGGRAVVISFHSLEDRMVKQAFQKMKQEAQVEILTKKPIEASREEVMQNPRSRSAKLRAVKLVVSD